MIDPQSFYNKEDVWDVALNAGGQNGAATPMEPAYVMATLPGQNKIEVVLMTPFTPRNKNNLIGVMMGRCDGENLGAVSVLMLSKQELIPGPMNISAYINQDQNISKDLTLWNQQGSHVLRGQILVMPVGNTFLYVDPIYIQASEGSMPQLKKIVLAVGNRLIYADTYEQGLQQLANGARHLIQEAAAPPGNAAPGQPPPAVPPGADARLSRVRDRSEERRI